MSFQKRLIADFLFVIQIIGAFIFCGAYILQSLEDVTGSSLAQFGTVATFLLFHFALGIGAYKAKPGRGAKQAIATYVTWFVLVSILMYTTGTNSDYHWNEKDTTTLATAFVLTVIVLAVGIVQRLSLADPAMKGSFAIAYKSVPQVLLGWKFLTEGASGTPLVSVIAGHATILIRLGQIYFMVREAGWDRNRKWLMISETVNELSWVVATIAWFVVM
ncbi:hypothetical protein L0Y69_01230 [bacterium]|nr:hypothetical protein [bacterium]